MNTVFHISKLSLLKELKVLKNANKSQNNRIAKMILKDERSFKYLLEIAVEYDNDTSTKAIWVIAHICEHRIDLLAHHFDYFINRILTLKNENSVKTIAKICNLLAKDYNSNQESTIQLIANQEHINKLIENSFDWLQSDRKVGTRANAMEVLYEFGLKISWIHYELKLILEKTLSSKSSDFKAKAKHILQAIANPNPSAI